MYKRKTECMVIVSMKPSTEISQKDLLLFQTCMSRYQRDNEVALPGSYCNIFNNAGYIFFRNARNIEYARINKESILLILKRHHNIN